MSSHTIEQRANLEEILDYNYHHRPWPPCVLLDCMAAGCSCKLDPLSSVIELFKLRLAAGTSFIDLRLEFREAIYRRQRQELQLFEAECAKANDDREDKITKLLRQSRIHEAYAIVEGQAETSSAVTSPENSESSEEFNQPDGFAPGEEFLPDEEFNGVQAGEEGDQEAFSYLQDILDKPAAQEEDEERLNFLKDLLTQLTSVAQKSCDEIRQSMEAERIKFEVKINTARQDIKDLDEKIKRKVDDEIQWYQAHQSLGTSE